MKHVIIILIFIMLSLGITAFILDMTKTKSVNNYLQIKEKFSNNNLESFDLGTYNYNDAKNYCQNNGMTLATKQ